MEKELRIVVDENMPGIDELFGDFGELIKVDGRAIDKRKLENADALLCRSVTRIDQNLLAETPVKFVGTATIGIDHLDIDWLRSENINWANAAGCNAPAVAQYVLSAIASWTRQRNKDMGKLTIGIIGAGNVGSKLAQYLDSLKIRYMLNDPLLKVGGDKRSLVSIDEILKCDVVTLHVPLTDSGSFPTNHLFSLSELERLSSHQLLINSSRGGVIDNRALVQYLSGSNLKDAADVVLDVYENEPNIEPLLLKQCLLATPHIAGHTLEGKLRGSWLIYKAFCHYFKITEEKRENDLYPDLNQIKLTSSNLAENLLELYDIESDSNSLASNFSEPVNSNFDRLRKNATRLANGKVRRDYTGWQYLGNYSLAF